MRDAVSDGFAARRPILQEVTVQLREELAESLSELDFVHGITATCLTVKQFTERARTFAGNPNTELTEQITVEIEVSAGSTGPAERFLASLLTVTFRAVTITKKGTLDETVHLNCQFPPQVRPDGWNERGDVPHAFRILIIPRGDSRKSSPIRLVHSDSESKSNQVREIVLLIHGIRTHANWQPMVRRVLQEVAGVKVIPIKYGYFDTFRFWCPLWTRRGPIEEVRREIQNARHAHPGARLSVIAHSFGTYAISQIMIDNTDLILMRLILSGSIIPRSYRWESVSHRIQTDVINDYGTRDIWPVLATSLSWGYGDTGRNEFGRGAAVVDRGHDYRHSDFFNEEFVRTYWKPWFESGTFTESPWPEHAPASPWLLSMLSIFPLKYVALLLLGFVAWYLLW